MSTAFDNAVTLIIDDTFLTQGGGVWATSGDKLWYNGSSSWAQGSNDSVKGSLQYSFQGTSIAFIGNTPHTSSSQIFTVSIDSGPEFTATYPVDAVDCQWFTSPQLSDGGIHTIELSGLDQTDVDYMLVTAGSSTPLTGQIIFVDDSSSEITWEGAWAENSGYTYVTGIDPAQPAGNGTHTSNSKGDSFSFQFAGTSILVGGIFSYQATGSITVSFSIDSKSSSQTFAPPSGSNKLVASSNYVYFQNAALSAGNHTFTVNVTDVTGNLSLVIDYLAYSPSFDFIGAKPNFTSTATSTSTSSTGAEVPSASASNGSTTGGNGAGSDTNSQASSATTSHVSTGAIAGGVAGGVIGIGALILLAFFFYRRSDKARRSSPSHSFVQPFNTAKTMPLIGERVLRRFSRSSLNSPSSFGVTGSNPYDSYATPTQSVELLSPKRIGYGASPIPVRNPASATEPTDSRATDRSRPSPPEPSDRMFVAAERDPELRQRMDEIAQLMRQMSESHERLRSPASDNSTATEARIGELQGRIDALRRENEALLSMYVTPPAYEGAPREEGSHVDGWSGNAQGGRVVNPTVDGRYHRF